MRNVLIFTFLFSFALSAYATDLEETATTKISGVQAYSDFGGGDFIFTVENSGQVCKGYWLPKETPGTANLIAMVIAAHKAKSSVQVWGHTDEQSRWDGTRRSHYCKVYSVKDLG